jgi:O-methyltransferase
MSLKDSVNSAIYRTTGFALTRESSEQRQAATQQAAARSRRRTARRFRRRMHKAWREREENARDRLRSQYDEKLGETVERVRERTMTGPVKLTALIEATRYVVRHEIPGAIVECGVWRGGSMQAVALTLLALGETDRELHLFDTFEGMPPPTSEDTRPTESGSVSAEELLAAADKDSKMWAIADLHDVQEAMAETSYPGERVHFHPGLVEDTTPSAAPDTIAILRLDTDWYESTKHELEHLYERLSPGGVLILDDYGDWSGSRKATDEWLANTGEPLFLAPMASGRIAVKPALHPHVGARG